MAKLIKLELIETETSRGDGTEKSPSRLVKQLFTTDGTLVLEYDPFEDKTRMVGSLLVELKWI